MANGDTPGIWTALATVLFHPLGHVLAALLIWAMSFSYYAGNFKAEVRALRSDVQRMEERLTRIDEFLRGRYANTPQN